MTWEEYYDKYYDWADSTKIKKLSSVEKLGPADELTDVMMDLTFEHEEISNRIARKAIAQNIVFSADNIETLNCAIDSDLLDKLFMQSASEYSQKDLELLEGLIDDELLAAGYKKKGYRLPETLSYLEEIDDADPDDEFVKELDSNRPGGIFKKLFMAFAIGSGVSQGINDAVRQKVHRYRIGDRVRVKYRGQEGTVIDINGDLYMVSLSDGRHVDSYYENQLERAW